MIAIGALRVTPSLFAASCVIGAAYVVSAILSVLLNRLQHRRAAPGVTADGWLLLAGLADQVFLTADALLLAVLVSTRVAGIYSAVYRIPNAWMTVVGLLITGLLPGITRRLTQHPDELARLRRRALQMGGAVAVVVVVSIPIAYALVPVVFGSAYESGQIPMCILLGASAVMTCTAGLAPIYYATRPDRLIALWLTVAATLNLAANLVVIPIFGMTGAAIVTFATQVLLSAFLFWQTRPSKAVHVRALDVWSATPAPAEPAARVAVQ